MGESLDPLVNPLAEGLGKLLQIFNNGPAMAAGAEMLFQCKHRTGFKLPIKVEAQDFDIITSALLV